MRMTWQGGRREQAAYVCVRKRWANREKGWPQGQSGREKRDGEEGGGGGGRGWRSPRRFWIPSGQRKGEDLWG